MSLSDRFLHDLRDALNHLYDPAHLRRSPLVSLLGLGDRLNVYLALQEALIEAIEALKPPREEQPRSPRWMIYQLLSYRYVRQFDQEQLADLLGISVRQLAREQNTALETLAGYLCKRHQLEVTLSGSHVGDTTFPTAGSHDAPESLDDLSWAARIPMDNLPDLRQTLADVLALIHPLVEAQASQIVTELSDDLPCPLVHPVALRQMLINTLTDAIQARQGSTIQVQVETHDKQIKIHITSRGGVSTSRSVPGNRRITENLVRLSGGTYHVSSDGVQYSADLIVGVQQPINVLVVEDNADTLELLRRYTVGTRYRLITTRDPAETLTLAESHSPHIIVLDIMMPQVDGWQVLADLRQHSPTAHVPVLVCSILAQEALARSLGATGFLQKPITRQAFVAALDRLAAGAAPEHL